MPTARCWTSPMTEQEHGTRKRYFTVLLNGFFFLLGFINRKIAVLGSGTGKRIVLKFKNNLHKKPELFGIVCRDVSFWFGWQSKISDEREGFARFFTRIFSCRPPQNSTSLPASPKTLDYCIARFSISNVPGKISSKLNITPCVAKLLSSYLENG